MQDDIKPKSGPIRLHHAIGLIHGRLLVTAWEEGIDNAEDQVQRPPKSLPIVKLFSI